jgi:hypothetical protein
LFEKEIFSRNNNNNNNNSGRTEIENSTIIKKEINLKILNILESTGTLHNRKENSVNEQNKNIENKLIGNKNINDDENFDEKTNEQTKNTSFFFFF